MNSLMICSPKEEPDVVVRVSGRLTAVVIADAPELQHIAENKFDIHH